MKDHQCTTCIEYGTKRAPIPTPKKRNSHPLELTHTDISGKITNTSFGGFQYFAVFLDDATARSAVFFLQNKSELLSSLKSYKALVETELPYKMKLIRLDQAGEHVSNNMKTFINQHGLQL